MSIKIWGFLKILLIIPVLIGCDVDKERLRELISSADNKTPLVNAGKDRTVNYGDVVTLQGQAADPDGEIIDVEWEQESGYDQISLSDVHILTPSFVVPMNEKAEVKSYRFKLNVTDNNGLRVTDSVTVTTDSNKGWSLISREQLLVTGLPGYDEDGDYSRLPDRVSSKLRSELQALEMNTAGGMISFMTDSNSLMINAVSEASDRPHMNEFITLGLDVYVDGIYEDTFIDGKFRGKRASYNQGANEIVGLGDGWKLIEVYLPLYGNIASIDIGVEESGRVKRPKAPENLIVFYGSSITQGCCASNSSQSFPVLVAKKLNLRHVNLGFSGNGLGDKEIADYIVELSPDYVVLDYWANPTFRQYENTLAEFVGIIKQGLPDSMIFITSTFYSPSREIENLLKDKVSVSVVDQLRGNGNNNIYYVPDLFGEKDISGLVDGLHLNSLGFKIVSTNLVDYLDGIGVR